jgi:hypothetical protein
VQVRGLLDRPEAALSRGWAGVGEVASVASRLLQRLARVVEHRAVHWPGIAARPLPAQGNCSSTEEDPGLQNGKKMSIKPIKALAFDESSVPVSNGLFFIHLD